MCHTYSFVKSLNDPEKQVKPSNPPDILVSDSAEALCRTILRYEKCGCGNIFIYLTCCYKKTILILLEPCKLLT